MLARGLKTTVALLTAVLMLVGCSTQKRTSTASISEEEVFALYDEVTGASSDMQILQDLKADTQSTIYFAESSDARPYEGLLSLNDMGFIPGFQQGQPITDSKVESVTVFFVDGVILDQRYFSLVLRIKLYDSDLFDVYTFTSDPNAYTFSKDDFTVTLHSADGGGSITLNTTDLSPKTNETLAGSVKLNLWLEDGGQSFYAGQISTLTGFGGLL